MTARSGLLFASSCRYRLRIGTVQMTVGPTRSIATSPADPSPVRARHQVITHAASSTRQVVKAWKIATDAPDWCGT